MLKIPEVRASVSLLSWMRNQTEFLTDVKSYSHYLEQAGYGVYTEDDLLHYQVYLNQFAKYIFRDGMHFELNMLVSISKRNKEIFFKLHKNSNLSNQSYEPKDDSFMSIEFACHYNDVLTDLKNTRDVINHIN